jgi:glycosyltransferase involved in cell wall biosynthesis
MILSILICTLEDRRLKLERLLSELLPQCEKKEVEVRIECDAGGMTVGEKRNKLLREASGEYITFVDDDDEVVEDYVDKILAELVYKPDCVGIVGVILQPNKKKALFSHSIEYAGWYDDGRMYYRTPNHLNPVKREIALRVGFENKDFGEDMLYSNGIRPQLQTERYIEDPIYIYHNEGKEEEQE